jgi:hypothetical protein
MLGRARDMAACLRLDEALIRRLQARGYLLNFDLSEAEIRERLYRAHRRDQLSATAPASPYTNDRSRVSIAEPSRRDSDAGARESLGRPTFRSRQAER